MNYQYWQHLCAEILSNTAGYETLSIGLNAEDSLFLRFNQSRLRQATHLEQANLELTYQLNQRQVQISFTLTGQIEQDLRMALQMLERLRLEAKELPADPFLVPFENFGNSFQENKSQLPEAKQIINDITSAHQGIDQSGFYCGGPLIRANCNSLGQNHWFYNDAFFYDYSLFTKNQDGSHKAIKGCYSEQHWRPEQLAQDLKEKNYHLQLLERPNRKLTPSTYRAYLAPDAVSAFADLLSWGAFSYAAHRQGRAAMTSLADGKENLSPALSLKENFELGLSPRFNSMGELAPLHLPIVESGKLQQWLVTSRAAKEYGVPGNASENGAFRSLEILPGHLPENQILQQLGTGVYLGSLHYLNWSDIPNARVTGMTRYACFWVENGEIVSPIEDMRFDESLFRVFGSELLDLTTKSYLEPNIMTYEQRSVGGRKLPGILLKEFRFLA